MELEEAYRVLEVSPGATEDEARDARKALAKVWHPDRHANDPELQKRAQAKLADVNAAFKRLKDAGFPKVVPKVASTPAELAAVARMSAARSGSLDLKATQPGAHEASVAAVREARAQAEARAKAKLEELAAEDKREAERTAKRGRGRGLLIGLVLVAVVAAGAFAIVKLLNASDAPPTTKRDDPWDPEQRPKTRARTIGLGATESDVRAALGEPTEIQEAFGHWSYGFSTITMKDGRVIGWWVQDELRGKVHLEPRDRDVAARARAAGTFGVGASTDEVIALQGTPDRLDPTFRTWSYDGADVRFDDTGHVTAWTQFRDILHVREGRR